MELNSSSLSLTSISAAEVIFMFRVGVLAAMLSNGIGILSLPLSGLASKRGGIFSRRF